MFFRYDKGVRIPVDLDNMFSGSCFIAGGHPSLLKENLELLKQPGIPVISINNTASKIPTNIWIGMDKPMCYSSRILLDPKIMKFSVVSRRDLLVPTNNIKIGTKMKDLQNMYFFGTNENFNIHNFLNSQRDFVWWKNTFYDVIQLAYRLGFRRVYLIGCGFKISKEQQYSYKTNLDNHQINYNQRTYNNFVEKMKLLKPHFKQKGFEIISCTPDSALNDFYPFMKFEDAVKEILKDFPKEYNTEKCLHSSEMASEKLKNIEALKEIVRKGSKII